MSKHTELISSFHKSVFQSVSNTWANNDTITYLSALKDEFEVLCDAVIKIGKSNHDNIYGEKEPEEKLISQTILFVWLEKAKQFLILWRDVQSENQKAQIYQLAKKISTTRLTKQIESSKQIILDANNELSKVLDNKIQEIKSKKNGEAKQSEQWEQQESPWETYKIQLNQLLEQSKVLFEENKIINQSAQKLDDIKRLIHAAIEQIDSSVIDTLMKIENASTFISENENHTLIAKYIDKINAYSEDETYLRKLSQNIDEKINEFEDKSQVACSTYGGIIQYKEIAWKKSVRQWLESEILPQIYEMWEMKDSIGSGSNMTFVNIKNRALLESSENDSNTKEDFLLPLNNFRKKIKKSEESILEAKEKISTRIKEDLVISNIYENIEFLNIPLQSTINQLRLDQNELLERIGGWWKNQWSRITSFRNSIKDEEALGVSEKVVRCIQSKTINTNNSQYANIFLTKGYIGESFWVGRKKEIEQIRTNISNWRDGYRGAVILSGQRLSGKSIFGELICSKYFRGEVIRLQPNSSIFIQGRQLKTTHNLADALEFVKKYLASERPMVWIDDLELWANENFTMGQNVRTLCKFIDSHAGRIFFMVSMGNALKSRMDNIFDISRVFQSEVNLDNMKKEEIQDAIMIRHGATHKTLVNEKNEELSTPQFKKKTADIYYYSNGNIGQALNDWAASIHFIDEENVTQRINKKFYLPEFLTPDIAIILSAILTQKRTNEYQLRKKFGPEFKENYIFLLRRLISTGLLKRHIDGWLEINEVVVNEVGQQLHDYEYIKFNQA